MVICRVTSGDTCTTADGEMLKGLAKNPNPEEVTATVDNGQRLLLAVEISVLWK